MHYYVVTHLDDVAQDEERIRITMPLFVIYTIFSIFGIIFAFACSVFNLWFRKQKYASHCLCITAYYNCHYRFVELGSPYVNIMIVAGAIVFYATVILFGVDENVASDTIVDGLCQTRIWLVSIGFSLLYGTILAKTWKIYYTFNYTKSESKTVRVVLTNKISDDHSISQTYRKSKIYTCLELLEYSS